MGSNQGQPQHGKPTGTAPKTATQKKLDDLEDLSRRLQRDEARRHATGHATNPERDW